ncbi:hypothetical protein LTR37_014645 [Vermiconidia calcicola]|uniref:Uncharacterized protein n=1 Tax=Vermiconidia calcicola TaxID=1690605 RepID=A0ACC3MT30_9PEZI|nr:hypothetical protein LTR37_014645 [Vermiconidia calcicola]
MGLLTTGVKYGAVFVAAREGMKAYENRKDKKHAQQQQHQSQPMQYDPTNHVQLPVAFTKFGATGNAVAGVWQGLRLRTRRPRYVRARYRAITSLQCTERSTTPET